MQSVDVEGGRAWAQNDMRVYPLRRLHDHL